MNSEIRDTLEPTLRPLCEAIRAVDAEEFSYIISSLAREWQDARAGRRAMMAAADKQDQALGRTLAKMGRAPTPIA